MKIKAKCFPQKKGLFAQDVFFPQSRTQRLGEFSNTMKTFVQGKRDEGFAYKDAMKEWKDSDLRKKLLINMPLSEKKKRRFVEQSLGFLGDYAGLKKPVVDQQHGAWKG